MCFHFLMKFWNETAAGNPVSVSVKIIITFLLFVQDWESFSWSSPAAAEHQNRSHPISSSEAVREAVRKWAQLQAGQKIFWSLYLQSLSATVVRCTALKESPSGTRPSLSVSTKRQGYVINSRTVTFVSPNYFSFLSFCFGTFL